MRKNDPYKLQLTCAGYGKAGAITRRIAVFLEKKPEIRPGDIVAFTFTEKADDPMEARMVKAINRTLPPVMKRISLRSPQRISAGSRNEKSLGNHPKEVEIVIYSWYNQS